MDIVNFYAYRGIKQVKLKETVYDIINMTLFIISFTFLLFKYISNIQVFSLDAFNYFVFLPLVVATFMYCTRSWHIKRFYKKSYKSDEIIASMKNIESNSGLESKERKDFMKIGMDNAIFLCFVFGYFVLIQLLNVYLISDSMYEVNLISSILVSLLLTTITINIVDNYLKVKDIKKLLS